MGATSHSQSRQAGRRGVRKWVSLPGSPRRPDSNGTDRPHYRTVFSGGPDPDASSPGGRRCRLAARPRAARPSGGEFAGTQSKKETRLMPEPPISPEDRDPVRQSSSFPTTGNGLTRERPRCWKTSGHEGRRRAPRTPRRPSRLLTTPSTSSTTRSSSLTVRGWTRSRSAISATGSRATGSHCGAPPCCRCTASAAWQPSLSPGYLTTSAPLGVGRQGRRVPAEAQVPGDHYGEQVGSRHAGCRMSRARAGRGPDRVNPQLRRELCHGVQALLAGFRFHHAWVPILCQMPACRVREQGIARCAALWPGWLRRGS
jgi:hypothetical protein